MAADHVAAVRQFNRFHTRLVGVLDDRLLASDYALPQVRLLYEIAHAPAGRALTAAEIVKACVQETTDPAQAAAQGRGGSAGAVFSWFKRMKFLEVLDAVLAEGRRVVFAAAIDGDDTVFGRHADDDRME